MMFDIILHLVLLGCGIGLMIWGADSLIEIVQYISQKFQLSQVITGAILLGFGTSLPEIVISFNSLAKGTPMIAYGNALGSNIANIGLILGLGLCLSHQPLVAEASETRYQFLMLGMSVLFFASLAYNLILNPLEAWLSIILFFGCLGAMVLNRAGQEEIDTNIKSYKPKRITVMVVAGIVAIGVGGELTVNNAKELAVALGVSTQLISLVLVALGTSLPELVVTVQLALKGHPKMIIGNIMGSNIFNLLLVLPIVYTVSPLSLERGEVYRDGGVILLLTFLFMILGFSWQGKRKMHYKSGLLLLLIYFSYLGYLTLPLLV